MKIEILDDFLPLSEFKLLYDFIMGDYFPWYYSDGIYAVPEPRRFQHIHNFYSFGQGNDGKTSKFEVITPLLQRLKIRSLIRVKANATFKTFLHESGGMHTDLSNVGPHKTAIYYVNTNNGYTKLRGHGKVKSVANRMLTFDSNLEHTGFTCTNEKRRVVINFNYYEE